MATDTEVMHGAIAADPARSALPQLPALALLLLTHLGKMRKGESSGEERHADSRSMSNRRHVYPMQRRRHAATEAIDVVSGIAVVIANVHSCPPPYLCADCGCRDCSDCSDCRPAGLGAAAACL